MMSGAARFEPNILGQLHAFQPAASKNFAIKITLKFLNCITGHTVCGKANTNRARCGQIERSQDG